MTRLPSLLPRGPRGYEALIALLVLCCLVGFQPVGLAAPPHDMTFVGTATPGVLVADFFGETIGNRSRMIQAAAVVVAIGVFILTRSIK